MTPLAADELRCPISLIYSATSSPEMTLSGWVFVPGEDLSGPDASCLFLESEGFQILECIKMTTGEFPQP